MSEIRPVGPTHPIVQIQRQDHPPSSQQDKYPRQPKKPREDATEDDGNNTPTIDEYV